MNDLTKLINALLNTILKWYYSSPLLFIIICVALAYLYFRNKGDGDFWFGLKPLQTVEDLIRSWSPRRCSTHDDYKNSLYNYLRDNLTRPRVEKEYGIGRTSIDIAVGDKVAIEIKLNFNKTTEFHRLKGQLDDYLKEFDKAIIVFCGDCDEALVDKFEEGITNEVRIVEK